MENIVHSLITVIIPSIGRSTLSKSLDSLIQQNNSKWTACVGFDGCNPPQPLYDPRINYVYLKKVGDRKNYGGAVRNILFPLVMTDWMCFLDDDDTFKSDYIDSFANEVKNNPDADCIVFKMSYDFQNQKVLPSTYISEIKTHFTGISFAVKKSFITQNSILFENGPLENFFFLEKIQKNNGKIVFSKNITYNVGF